MFLKKLFAPFSARSELAADSGPDRVEAILAKMRAAARPCLRLAPADAGRSQLGGTPRMAAAWPRFEGRPMGLVAQLDLAEIQAAAGPDDFLGLPGAGRLLFFYDLELGGWGFDPKEAGSSVVIYEAGDAALATEPDDLPADARFDAYPVTFVADVSFPSEERAEADLAGLSRREARALEAAVEAMQPGEPAHQVGGYAGPVQGDDMELQCQLVTNGLNTGSPEGYAGPRAAALRPGAADWRLLLQVDTDDGAGMMWGDTGRLYFWIREADARAGDFSRTWTILQCC